MRILFVTSELSPLVSTGGLAEVAAALPRALHDQGHDVRVAMPCYQQILEAHRGVLSSPCTADYGNRSSQGALRTATVPDTHIPLYLIEHDGYFGRQTPYGTGAYEFDDNAERFCFFCLALLDAIPGTGWMPDVVHCNDWHTAPLPIFLATRYRTHPQWRDVATLFTIHNLAYQGRYDALKFAATGFPPELLSPEYLEYEGDINLMKGALVLADKLNTVSPRYAREIQTVDHGNGLNTILHARRHDLYGILNGVDYSLWNPTVDPLIAANYDAQNMDGKKRCKETLQDTFELPRSNAPVFGIVSRLHWQKGLDLLADALDSLMTHELQLVVLGSGDPAIEASLREAQTRHPKKLGLHFGFDAPCAHAIQGGSDFLLMPSRYEPCGLGQLFAMAYGTIPIVRRTGGLADTVRPFRPVLDTRSNRNATGIAFVPLTPQALTRSIQTALHIYDDSALLQRMRRNGMAEKFSWRRSCEAYVDLYHKARAER